MLLELVQGGKDTDVSCANAGDSRDRALFNHFGQRKDKRW